jgi:hypothetical protein
MFFSCSWLFSLLPSCLPIMLPDSVQVIGNLIYYWGPNVGLIQGNSPEHMLGCLGCPQGCDLLTSLQLPALYSAALQYQIGSEEAVNSLSRWVCESG